MQVEVKNLGIIKSAKLEFVGGLNLIVGSSSSGKSTLLRGIKSLMSNSFSDSNISYGEKKMAIKVTENGHSVTYLRDLTNPSRKSAYQIDGKVYTKVGKNTLDEITDLFHLSPVEIDGEKINFNYSAQFSGPFLLLGSASLLYSILTYRSQFDITKINDLYFEDYKKLKQDIAVLIKTRQSLDTVKSQQEQELESLKEVPDFYEKVTVLKKDISSFNKLEELVEEYYNSIKLRTSVKSKLTVLEQSLEYLSDFLSKLELVALIEEEQKVSKEIGKVESHKFLLETAIKEIFIVEEIYNTITLLEGLSRNLSVRSLMLEYDSQFKVIDLEQLELLMDLAVLKNSKEETEKSKSLVIEDIQVVENQLSSVSVCPLCGMKLGVEHGH